MNILRIFLQTVLDFTDDFSLNQPFATYEQYFRHLVYFYNGLMLGIGPTGTMRVGLMAA